MPAGGGARGSPLTPVVQALTALGSHFSTKAGQRERPVLDNDGDVADGGTPKLPISTLEMCDPSRGMRPAGTGRSLPPKPVVDLSDVREQAVGRPLSAEAPEFSPALVPQTQETGSVVRPSVAGTMAPVGFAGLSVPVVAGMEFSAVAEVHSSSVDEVDDTLVVRASEQRSDRSWNPRRSPGMVDRPVTNLSTPELLEHSVPNEDMDGRPMEGLSVLEPLEHSVLDEDLDGRPMEGRSGPEPLEHSVLDVILERGSREELSALEPLEHSVPEVASDIRHIRGLKEISINYIN